MSKSARRKAARSATPRALDAVTLRLFHHLLGAIPEEMGIVLRRTAFSINIKERLDFSCAVTGREGALVAQASHIPVHLGSAHLTAAMLMERLTLARGDVVLVNDPWAGGTHLPDITLFAPVFALGGAEPAFGLLVRAHHADVGGANPGSMGPALDLFGEGLVIPPVKLVRGGVLQQEVLDIVLANTRTPEERRGDLLAQLAAIRHGEARLGALMQDVGASRLAVAATALRQHARRSAEALIARMKPGRHRAEGCMDGPGTPVIAVTLARRGRRLTVDFSGTSPQVAEPLNANRAITTSAVFYVLRLLLDPALPANSGCLDPLDLVLPEGSLVNARRPAAVAGGNVETSQRLVDVLLEAMRRALGVDLPAASQGTMNNFTAGGVRADGSAWTFYETLGGGAGASAGRSGESGLQVHMTNTLNSPIEALEAAFPVRVRAYHLRAGSGGDGAARGGDGLVREFEFLTPAQVTMLATRRREGAAGAAGGSAGASGVDSVLDASGAARPLAGSSAIARGARVRIETPGGGGFGRAASRRRPQT